MISTLAAGYLSFSIVAVALFQLALALGAPLGQYAFGGRNHGRLPVLWRLISLVSFFAYLALVGHYLAQANLLPKLITGDALGWLNWGLAIAFVVGFLLNTASRSELERKLWVPISGSYMLAALLVALAL